MAVDLFTEEVLTGYPKARILPMSIEGLKGTLFFTNFQGSTDLNYQINYAFNSDVYAYMFGDKLSMSRITGIAFQNETCKTTLKSTPKDFVKYYKKYKLGSTKARRALRIAIGGMTLSGYFVSLNINLVGGKDNTYTFSFSFLGKVK